MRKVITRLFAGVIAVIALTVLTGCMTPRSFVDPTYPKVSYDDVQKRETPLRLKLSVEFQRNGQHYSSVDQKLLDNTERVLRASGVITPDADGGDGEIHVVVNNIADMGAATAKGLKLGVTFGLAGTIATDAYEMSVTMTVHGKTITRTEKHAIQSALGNTRIPEGMEVMPPDVAFQKVVEQMLLRALQDIQHAGELAWLGAPRVPSA